MFGYILGNGFDGIFGGDVFFHSIIVAKVWFGGL